MTVNELIILLINLPDEMKNLDVVCFDNDKMIRELASSDTKRGRIENVNKLHDVEHVLKVSLNKRKLPKNLHQISYDKIMLY